MEDEKTTIDRYRTQQQSTKDQHSPMLYICIDMMFVLYNRGSIYNRHTFALFILSQSISQVVFVSGEKIGDDFFSAHKNDLRNALHTLNCWHCFDRSGRV